MAETVSTTPDLAVAGRRLWSELRAAVGKAVVGGDEAVRLVTIALLADGHVLVEDVPGHRQDAARPRRRARPVARHRAPPGHARPAPERRHRRQPVRARRPPLRRRARCSRTSCWSTRSTGRRRAPSRRCSRRCRSTRSRSRARPAACPTRSSCWRPRTPSSSRARSRSRRRSSTGSCSAPGSATRTPTASAGSPAATRRPPTPSTPIEPVIDRERLLAVRDRVRTVRVADEVEAYIVDLVRATRGHPDIELGASPRATVALYRAAQAAAVLEGRDVRDARRRQGRRPGRAGPPAHRRPRPHASTARPPTRVLAAILARPSPAPPVEAG